jgi:hypothetical protein
MNTTITRDTAASAATTPSNVTAMPMKLRKWIGSTMFTVNIHFSSASAETVEDKIFRLIAREVEQSA